MGWWDKHWILKKQRNRDYEIIGYNINRIYRIYYIWLILYNKEIYLYIYIILYHQQRDFSERMCYGHPKLQPLFPGWPVFIRLQIAEVVIGNRENVYGFSWVSSPWYPWHRKEQKRKEQSQVKFIWCFCFARLSKLTSWLVLPLNKPGIDSRRPKYLSRMNRQVLMTLKTCSLIGTLSSFNIAMDYKWQLWPWLTFEKWCCFIHSYVSLPEDIQLMLMKIELILENH